MPYTPTTGDRLLAAWLSLTSTLWNKRPCFHPDV